MTKLNKRFSPRYVQPIKRDGTPPEEILLSRRESCISSVIKISVVEEMIRHMTNSEEQVMKLLWQSNRALSCSEIAELSVDKTWKDSYIHAIIKSLIKKGIVKVEAFELVSRSYARKFAPRISYDEYVLLSSFSPEELNDIRRMYDFILTIWENSDTEKLKSYIKKKL